MNLEDMKDKTCHRTMNAISITGTSQCIGLDCIACMKHLEGYMNNAPMYGYYCQDLVR